MIKQEITNRETPENLNHKNSDRFHEYDKILNISIILLFIGFGLLSYIFITVIYVKIKKLQPVIKYDFEVYEKSKTLFKVLSSAGILILILTFLLGIVIILKPDLYCLAVFPPS
ncbi:MAG: hypothetical protein JW982_06360 [Spirochaetes bacterium]|nr:hypothetical protein [Spirochaetota bacterium]